MRISARFLRMDYQRIYTAYRTVEGGYCILTKDPDEVGSPDWAVLSFEGPTPVEVVSKCIREASL